MTTLPQWILSLDEIQLAETKGFEHSESNGRSYLKRQSDQARIWPHIDGFISCFLRQGQFVRHRKYKNLPDALHRQFGDSDEH